jgi:hypothetical protein
MNKIFSALRHWLVALFEVECPPDPLSRMTLADLADLPTVHPRHDDGCAC